MCAARVGAVLVVDGDLPVGILSERDVLTRIVDLVHTESAR